MLCTNLRLVYFIQAIQHREIADRIAIYDKKIERWLTGMFSFHCVFFVLLLSRCAIIMICLPLLCFLELILHLLSFMIVFIFYFWYRCCQWQMAVYGGEPKIRHIRHKLPWHRLPSQIGYDSCQKIRHCNLPWRIFDNTVWHQSNTQADLMLV